ncbi:hypothetical protein MHYP_G00092130 [Metynnis hypsauchen]
MEERLGNMEDKTTQLEKSVSFLMRQELNLAAKCDDLESRLRRNNIRIHGIPEGSEKKDVIGFISNFLCSTLRIPDSEIRIERAHRSLLPKPRENAPPRGIIVRFVDCRMKDRIIQQAWKQKITYERQTVYFNQDYTTEVQKRRKQVREVIKKLKEKSVKAQSPFPAQLRVMLETGTKTFATLSEAAPMLREMGISVEEDETDKLRKGMTQENWNIVTRKRWRALQLVNSSLKELDLSNNDLQDSGAELLSAGLKSPHCKLEILRLPLCNIGRKSCENLGSALQLVNSSLKELDLSNNDLQDSGAELLSAGLKSPHCKLEILRLSGCMITEEGCFSLASSLSANPSHLKELDLTYNHPGDKGVKLLSARLEDPNCTLDTLRVDYGGEVRLKPGVKKYSCDVTLDPNTANTHLSLSEENRKVEFVEERQSYPDHPGRFDCPQVLCRESLTGRCYWEAEWSGEVYIAVSYKGIGRKGGSDCRFGRNEQSWILSCSNFSFSVWHNYKHTLVSASSSQSNRVGVYLDCPAGSLSFYSVSTETHRLTHLHTFSCSFTEPLYAGFGVFGSGSSVCVRENIDVSWSL